MILEQANSKIRAVEPFAMTRVRRSALVLALIACALSGCGPRSDRLAISGTVTLDGTPLDSGSIRFTSLGEAKLMTSGAVIKDGAYIVPQAKGLRVGSYQVEISSPDANAKPVLDRPSGMLMAPERIPTEYNIESKHTIEVTADGDNAFDFDIVSKLAK
jgi:hypothetical protein